MKHARSTFFALLPGILAALAALSLEGVASADEEAAPWVAGVPILPAEPAPGAPAADGSPAPSLPAAEAPLAPAPVASPAPLPVLPAASAPPAAEPAASVEHDGKDMPIPDPVLQPGQVDVRASLHTTPIAQYGGIGAGADVGLRKVGPGILAVGGGLDYFFCGTTCASSPLSFTQRQFALEGRISYHLAAPKLRRVDFYPLVTAGFVLSRSTISIGDNTEYRGSDVAPTIGFGAGASYFFADRFFVAAEARFRYAAGTYAYELASGRAQTFDRSGVDTWNASTVDLAGAVGTRF